MSVSRSVSRSVPVVQPAWLRVWHWVNVVAVLVLMTSGWQIYNASPLFHFRFPRELAFGGWLGGALLWHFAAMWLLAGAGAIYLALNIVSGRFRRRFWPLSVAALWADLVAALRGRLAHEDLAHYNAVQKAAYLFVVADLALLVVSGLVIWKSVQFPLLRALLGGYDQARVVHFLGMTALLAFVIVHVVMVALVPKSFPLIVRGR
jgi:thiosulfate reductase cytochrome b subunit